MAITKEEHQKLNILLEEIKKNLPVEDSEIKELKAQKSYSFRQPVFAACVIKLQDPQFSSFTYRYFPEDWKWGEPHKLLQGKIFLGELTIVNALSSLKKAPFFGGAGLFTIQGNEEVKIKSGFLSSKIVGFKFKSLGRNKDNQAIVEKINNDKNLLDNLNKEFSTIKGRPLPDFRYIDSAILPLGGFDIFDIDGQKEKISDDNFWRPEDPKTIKRIIQRIEVLRPFVSYIQDKTA
jgi:hypothetical protein